MKKVYILLVTMFVVISSCQRSQFPTTTRQIKNGKVNYVNLYPVEKRQLSKVTIHKKHLKYTGSQKSISGDAGTGKQSIVKPEIKKINPVPLQEYENLIASTSNEPTIIAMRENHVIDAYLHPDTIDNKSRKEETSGPSGRQAIFFKNGKKEMVKIISQSNDTLFYKLNKEDNVVRGVKMEQVETILRASFGEQVLKFKNGSIEGVNVIFKSNDTLFYTSIRKPNIVKSAKMGQIDSIVNVKYYDSVRGRVVDTRKNEPLSMTGFISSILGLVPIFGLPFAIMGLIFGYKGLKKIHANPLRFRGTKFAKASITLGIIGLIIFLISLIVALSSSVNSCHSSGAHFGP
jgi:hypothetical protein